MRRYWLCCDLRWVPLHLSWEVGGAGAQRTWPYPFMPRALLGVQWGKQVVPVVRPRDGHPADETRFVKTWSCFTIILSLCSYWRYLCWNIYIIVCVNINYTPLNKISPPISLINERHHSFQNIALKQAFAWAVLSPSWVRLCLSNISGGRGKWYDFSL